MSSLAEIFGECRSLLYGPRSQASFELLLAQIERAYELIGDDVEDAGLMRYTREGVAAWPAELRYVPLAKLYALFGEGGGGAAQQLSLCGALSLDLFIRIFLKYPKLSGAELFGALNQDAFSSLQLISVSARSWSSLGFLELLNHAELSGLKGFLLNGFALTPAHVRRLMAQPFWSSLERVGLIHTKLRGDAWKDIFKELGTLRGVDLGFNTLPAPLLAWLLQSAGPAQVERLGLESVAPKGSAAAALGMFEWPKLRELDLSFVVLSSAELGQILARMRYGALRELRLNSCGLMPDAPWELLGQCGAFERLSLRDNTLDLAAIDRLVASGALDAVVELDLARCALGESATERLLDGLAGGPIKRLELSHNGLTIESWRRLLSHPALAGLEWLGVGAQREPGPYELPLPVGGLSCAAFALELESLKPGWAWS